MEEKDERVGIFPSWTWVYLTVIVYARLLILLLYILTIALDHSIQ